MALPLGSPFPSSDPPPLRAKACPIVLFLSLKWVILLTLARKRNKAPWHSRLYLYLHPLSAEFRGDVTTH